MNTETAKKASKLIKEIEGLQHQITLIDNVSEFTEITFSGENGAEKKYSFRVNETDFELKNLLLYTAKGYLKNTAILKYAELEKL